MIAVMPAAPSRRAVLRLGGLGLAAVAVSGCSGDRRRTPWSPSPGVEEADPSPPPDTELLVAARDRVARYRTMLAGVTPEGSGQRAEVNGRQEVWPVQQERLETLLSLSGVEPAPADDAALTSAPEGGSSTGAPVAVADLAQALLADLPTAFAEVARSTPTNRAMLTSLAAEHAFAAQALGADPPWPMLVGPAGTAAVPVLGATRPAAVGLEVVAARSGGEERERYESILASLQAITRTLTTLAGDAAPVPPLGYDLPEPLDTADQRAELARTLVLDIAPAVLSVADRAGSSAEQVRSLVRIVVEASTWGRRLGAPVDAFPGMTLP
ncbi:hypothetical protein [Serinicoccus sp. LYQ92]|uniref:hypothetical protein n=1 Tax=Serinicoccus sp. LYQ92 TaxID=3378798 RepID=UPI003862151F